MLEATVEVRIPGCWVSRLAEAGATVRVVDRKIVAPGAMKSLFEITHPGEGVGWGQIVNDIRDHPSVAQVRAVQSDEERLLGIVRCENCNSCRALVSSECFVTNAVTREGAMEWTVRFDDKRKLARLLEDLRRTPAAAEVKRLVSVRDGSVLTRRQTEVLRLALDMGYFEFPKHAGVEDLAKRLGVSKSTVCETLHRAERKVLREFLGSGP